MKWYPPAEPGVSLGKILCAVFPAKISFEKELKDYLDAGHCVLGNSARSLLYLLLSRLKEHDAHGCGEVLIPGYTCYSLAASVVKARLKIRVYDLDPASFNPDMDSVKRGLDLQPLAVVTQHLFGVPARIEGVAELAREAGVAHIEDAAQGLGASLSGKKAGVWGDFGLLSFGRGKPLPLGGGGALVTSRGDTDGWFEAGPGSRGYRQLTVTACARLLSSPRIYGLLEALPLGLGESVFDPGFRVSPMPEALSRLGMVCLGSLEALNRHRREIARIYREGLPEEILVPVPESSVPVYTRFPALVSGHPIPGPLVRLGARRMYPNAVVDVPGIRPYLSDRSSRSPGASAIAQRLITLPTHGEISAETAGLIAGMVRGLPPGDRRPDRA